MNWKYCFIQKRRKNRRETIEISLLLFKARPHLYVYPLRGTSLKLARFDQILMAHRASLLGHGSTCGSSNYNCWGRIAITTAQCKTFVASRLVLATSYTVHIALGRNMDKSVPSSHGGQS